MDSKTRLQQAVSTLKGQKILLCPLNWGLGHATRCVPIVQELLRQGKEVVIAADGFALEFLKQEFPDLKAVKFIGMKVKYSKQSVKVLAKILFPQSITSEHRRLKNLLQTPY